MSSLSHSVLAVSSPVSPVCSLLCLLMNVKFGVTLCLCLSPIRSLSASVSLSVPRSLPTLVSVSFLPSLYLVSLSLSMCFPCFLWLVSVCFLFYCDSFASPVSFCLVCSSCVSTSPSHLYHEDSSLSLRVIWLWCYCFLASLVSHFSSLVFLVVSWFPFMCFYVIGLVLFMF